MTVDPEQKPLLDEDGNPYEPYTAEELAIMWQTHYPQAEDGDSWFTGRWLATVKELHSILERIVIHDNTWYLAERVEELMPEIRKVLGKEEEPKEGTP